MKSLKVTYIVSLLLCCGISCSDIFLKQELKNEETTIEIYACSRGCFQYLLNVRGKLYFPKDELPKEFLLYVNQTGSYNFEDYPMKVLVSGNILDEERDITKPGAHDGPIYDFSVPIIVVSKIKKN